MRKLQIDDSGVMRIVLQQEIGRSIGNTETELADPSPLLVDSFGTAIQYTGSRDYLDLVASDQIFGNVQLQVGVNNVLD